MCPTALVLASPYEAEDDDFVVTCTNRAVLDVGLLSLHDLRADSLIRPIASRSVILLLMNHCHFNNPIFFCIFLLPSPRATTMAMQAGFSLYFVSNLMKCTVTVF